MSKRITKLRRQKASAKESLPEYIKVWNKKDWHTEPLTIQTMQEAFEQIRNQASVPGPIIVPLSINLPINL